MNKTVKTIAWICLVLGLMGLAVDAGVYMRGRAFATQMAERIEAGEIPAIGGRWMGSDDSGDTDAQEIQPRDGSQEGRLPLGGMRGGMDRFGAGRRAAGFGQFGFGLPILLLAAGPVLAVVGAVMLIVNRVPNGKEKELKNEKVKKAKKNN
jgi:hypothetical protein